MHSLFRSISSCVSDARSYIITQNENNIMLSESNIIEQVPTW